MTQNPRVILLLSNGNGEDRIAVQLAREWYQASPQDILLAMPLVGPGLFYQQAGIRIVGQSFTPPSEGFAYLNPGILWHDIQAGVINHIWQQRRVVQGLRHLITQVIAVGDIVPLLVAAGLNYPLAFVGCALSDYYVTGRHSTYDPLQRWLLKTSQALIFPRDALTAANLCLLGLQAISLGNPMLDCMDTVPCDFKPTAGRPVVAVLPGSHSDAVGNFEHILKLLQDWPPTPWDLVVLVAPQVDVGQLANGLQQHHWSQNGLVWQWQNLRLWLCSAQSMGVLRHCFQAAIGLAGTANEQLAGYGIPVVSFVTGGTQYTWRFAEAQQRLLGPGLQWFHPVNSRQLYQALERAMGDPGYRQQVQQTANARFGQPGASQRIVQWILHPNGYATMQHDTHEIL